MDEQLRCLNQIFGSLYFAVESNQIQRISKLTLPILAHTFIGLKFDLRSQINSVDEIMRQIRLDLLTIQHALPGCEPLPTNLSANYQQLVRRFMNQISRRRSVEREWFKKLEHRYRRQLIIEHPDMTVDQVEHWIRAQLHSTSHNATLPQNQDFEQLSLLAQSVIQLQSMFQEMQWISGQSQPQIESIQESMSNAAQNTQQAYMALHESVESAKRQVFKRNLLIGILVVILLICTGFLIWLGIEAVIQ